MTAIVDIIGREILDSRGNPTVEVDVVLEDGSRGRAGVPSGASTGAHEAVELRDGDKKRYLGKGVRNAVEAVNGEIFDALTGMDAEAQVKIDETMIALDGTPNKARLGANAILGVSLAVAKAAAAANKLPLYRYVGGTAARLLPVPMMNIVNGGVHADNPIDFQEFMIMPLGVADACGSGARRSRKSFTRCARRSKPTATTPMWATRAALRPICRRREAALDFVLACHREGRLPGRRRRGDRARSGGERVLQGRRLRLRRRGQDALDCDQQVEYLAELVKRYPIVSIEDGMAEDDYDGWKKLTQTIGDRCQLVGDDIFVTNVARLPEGIKNGIGNSILIKVNQIGTLSETLAAVEMAHKARLHRGDVAPLRRDRGFDHRRPRGRHQLRADQDRLAGARRPHREIQSAPAHRGGTRRRRPPMPAARRSRSNASARHRTALYRWFEPPRPVAPSERVSADGSIG